MRNFFFVSSILFIKFKKKIYNTNLFLCRYKETIDVDYTKVKRGLYYIRNKSLPDSPKTIADIVSAFEKPDVKKHIGSSKHSEDIPFFIGCHEEESFAYCVFQSKYTIDLFASTEAPMPIEQRDNLMDSTFKCCPFGPFNQLLILYIRYQDKVSFSYTAGY